MGIFNVRQWIFAERIKQLYEVGIIVWTSHIISTAVKMAGTKAAVWSSTCNTAANIIQSSSFYERIIHLSTTLPQDIRRHKLCNSGIFCFMTNEKIGQHLKHKGLRGKFHLVKTCYYFSPWNCHMCILKFVSVYGSYEISSLPRKLLVSTDAKHEIVSFYIKQ